ncbi:MAG: general secretion pathway protein GspB [Candidatus Omnitrophota bacterium]|nr:general secretion pathway protein GspB [Candidatus Omnitrophota bacterium]
MNIKVSVLFMVCLCGAGVSAQDTDAGPQMYVGGVIWDTDPQAIVNGKLLRQGDTIQNSTVQRIDDEGVTFTYQGKTFRKRVGEGSSSHLSWGIPVASLKQSRVPARSDFFHSMARELITKAQASYTQAQEAYARVEEEAALQYYDAAIRNAQGAYAYANETERRPIQQFMKTCSERIHQIRGEPTKVDDVGAHQLANPEAIASWMSAHIAYRSDEKVQQKRDYWQAPHETLMLESGDCEDLAFLAQAFLEEIGVSSLVVMIEDKEKKSAHAMCVFGRTPPYNCFDGTTLHLVNKETIEDLVEGLYPGYYIVNRYVAHTPRSIPLFDSNGDVIIP